MEEDGAFGRAALSVGATDFTPVRPARFRSNVSGVHPETTKVSRRAKRAKRATRGEALARSLSAGRGAGAGTLTALPTRINIDCAATGRADARAQPAAAGKPAGEVSGAAGPHLLIRLFSLSLSGHLLPACLPRLLPAHPFLYSSTTFRCSPPPCV
jgi:hypothetical protein